MLRFTAKKFGGGGGGSAVPTGGAGRTTTAGGIAPYAAGAAVLGCTSFFLFLTGTKKKFEAAHGHH